MTTTTTSNNNKAAEMANSPAFRVLTVAAKKLLAIIAREIKAHGEPVPLSNEKLETDFGVPRSSIAPAVRELAALGFIAVEIAGPTHAFRLTDGWRSVQSAKEATIKAAVARQTKSKPPRTDAKPTKHDLDDMTRRELQAAKAHVDRNPASTRLPALRQDVRATEAMATLLLEPMQGQALERCQCRDAGSEGAGEACR